MNTDLHLKLRKYFKKIKIDPVYVELVPWKEFEMLHPTIDIHESLDIPLSRTFSQINVAIEALEEPIMKPMAVPKPKISLMPLPVVDFIIPPVISFANNINIKFPCKIRNNFDSESVLHYELPLIPLAPTQSIANRPKLKEMKIPLQEPISLKIEEELLSSLELMQEDCLQEPRSVENTITTELELPILHPNLYKSNPLPICKEIKVPSNLQGLHEVARRSYTSTQNLILKKMSGAYVNSLIEGNE